jgi:hypothetical protein
MTNQEIAARFGGQAIRPYRQTEREIAEMVRGARFAGLGRGQLRDLVAAWRRRVVSEVADPIAAERMDSLLAHAAASMFVEDDR